MTAYVPVVFLPKHYDRSFLMLSPPYQPWIHLSLPAAQPHALILVHSISMYAITRIFHHPGSSRETFNIRLYTLATTIQSPISVITVMFGYPNIYLQSHIIALQIWAIFSPAEKWTPVSLFRRFFVTKPGTPLTLTLTLMSPNLPVTVVCPPVPYPILVISPDSLDNHPSIIHPLSHSATK